MSTTPSPSGRTRRITVMASVGAALAGVAVAGTFALAQPDAKTTAKANAAAATKARVIVQRGPAGPQGKTGKTGARGARGATGPRGVAADDVGHSFSLNWLGGYAGRDNASLDVPGIGRLSTTCNPGTHELRLDPARSDVRTVMTADVFSGTDGDHQRIAVVGTPAVVQLPVSGIVTATLSLEPVNGDGGPATTAPATVTFSVESKSNADPADPSDQNFCYAAGQVLQAGA